MNDAIEKRIEVFLDQKSKFMHNPLQTELPNPETHNLSNLAQNDVKEAIKMIQRVDVKAIRKMLDYLDMLELLQKEIKEVFSKGNKVYFCGCGSSGRLAVALEYLWRLNTPENLKNSVIGFLAGGDNATIKAIEGFEDFDEYGIKQLIEAGFKDGDLLISATASGISQFVVAATEHASKTSVKPWFLHCNTNESLKGRIKNHVVTNPNVVPFSLHVGQMALTGSTRMQATTGLMIAMGLPLYDLDIKTEINKIANSVEKIDMTVLKDFIITEADTYKNKEFVLYETTKEYGLTVLTDTTERAPTFNLTPFENQLDENKIPAWCYILFPHIDNSKEAWKELLGRDPRCLNWNKDTSTDYLYGFDFSNNLISLRNQYASPSHIFSIKKVNGQGIFKFENLETKFDFSGLDDFTEQMVLKLIMNTSSTIMLGRLGYYDGNLMTSVYPSNSKLIDRAIRYIDFLVKLKTGIKYEYDFIAEHMFTELRNLKPNQSIVRNTVEKIVSLNKKF